MSFLFFALNNTGTTLSPYRQTKTPRPNLVTVLWIISGSTVIQPDPSDSVAQEGGAPPVSMETFKYTSVFSVNKI